MQKHLKELHISEMQALLKGLSTSGFANILLKDQRAQSLLIITDPQLLRHVPPGPAAWARGFLLTDGSILCLFSALPLCCSTLANSESWGLGLQHKGFPKKLLKLLKICVNICWDLLQATDSRGDKGEAILREIEQMVKTKQSDIPGQLQCLCE